MLFVLHKPPPNFTFHFLHAATSLFGHSPIFLASLCHHEKCRGPLHAACLLSIILGKHGHSTRWNLHTLLFYQARTLPHTSSHRARIKCLCHASYCSSSLLSSACLLSTNTRQIHWSHWGRKILHSVIHPWKSRLLFHVSSPLNSCLSNETHLAMFRSQFHSASHLSILLSIELRCDAWTHPAH